MGASSGVRAKRSIANRTGPSLVARLSPAQGNGSLSGSTRSGPGGLSRLGGFAWVRELESLLWARIGIPGSGSVPDHHLRVEVETTGPLERSSADAHAAEATVVGPEGFEYRAAQKLAEVSFDL